MDEWEYYARRYGTAAVAEAAGEGAGDHHQSFDYGAYSTPRFASAGRYY